MTRKGSTGPSQRQLRVGEALRHALAEILARGGLRDPELADLQATVTDGLCGPLAGGDPILLGRRDPATLVLLDGRSGSQVRALPLAGVPARIVR